MKILTSIFSISLLLIIWGCSKDNSPLTTEMTAEQQIYDAIANIEGSEDEDYIYADIDEESESNFTEPFDSFLQKPIVPLRFGRIRMHPISKDIRIVFTTDSTAEVFIYKVIKGKFITLAADTSKVDTIDIYHTIRPMEHEVQRIIHFVKKNDRWKMSEFSLALGNSLSNDDSKTVSATVNITKLIVSANGEVIEITNPLDYFQTRQNVFSYGFGAEVKLTVHIKNETMNPVYFPQGTEQTELVRLHHARHRLRKLHRIKVFTYRGKDDEGNNIYEGTWFIGDRLGVHHAIIDVIDNGTIFDDDMETYPYNSTSWSTPYKVTFP